MSAIFKAVTGIPSLTRASARTSMNLRNSSTNAGGNPGNSNSSLLKIGAIIAAGASAGYYFLGSQSSQSSTTSKTPSADERSAASAINPKEFSSFKLKEVQPVTHDTKLYRFEIPGNQALNLPVASCIVTRKPTTEGEKPVIRPYTPVSDEDAVGYFDLVIKHYPTGAMTSYIHGMKPGDSLECKGPFLKYLYKANTLEEVGLIAGGSGITPILQIVRKIFKDPKDKTKVSVIFANRTEKDILLKEELDSYAKSYPDQFKVHYVLDNPPPKWSGDKGYITKDIIQKHLPSKDSKNSMIFICGPDPMMKSISGNKKSPQDQGELAGILKEMGYEKENVFKF